MVSIIRGDDDFDSGDASGVGADQSWSLLSRSGNTSYQNTSGGPIQVSCYCFGDDQTSSSTPNTNTMRFEVSTNNTTWVVAQHALLERTGSSSSYARTINSNIIIPNTHYYRLFTNGNINYISMSELS